MAPLHSAAPLRLKGVGLVAGHPWLEPAVELPELLQVSILPDTGAEPGQERRAQGGRLGVERTPNRDAEEVRLQLAQHVHHGRPAVDAELAELAPCVAFHRLDDVPRLV